MKSYFFILWAAVGAAIIAFPDRLEAADGNRDSSFDGGTGLSNPTPGIAADGNGLAIQPDEEFIVSGLFTRVDGEPHGRIARLEKNGRIDDLFTHPDFSNNVICSAIQADGKIVVGGYFTDAGGVTRNRIARLNFDGTLDLTFNPNIDPGVPEGVPFGNPSGVFGLTIQPDGKIIVVGRFNRVNGPFGAGSELHPPVPGGGVDRLNICRLNPDGTVDPLFDPDANAAVHSVALRPDGTMIIGGEFSTLNDGLTPRSRIAELSPTGIVLPFRPVLTGFAVDCLVIQADGKIVAGGQFSVGGAAPRTNFARFDPDGTLDAGFVDIGIDGPVLGMAQQTDGEIIITGVFNDLGGNARKSVARIEADGRLGPFDPESDGIVWGAMIQADGRVLITGDFSAVDGSAVGNITRLVNGNAPTTLSVPDTTRVEWLRGGASAEADYVTFELSVDGGATWTFLGSPLGLGTRIPGGWEVAGLTLPDDGMIRARARTRGATYNGSSSLLEQILTYDGGSGSGGGGGGGGSPNLVSEAGFAASLATYYFYYYDYFGAYYLSLAYYYFYAGQSQYYTDLTNGRVPEAHLAYYNGLALFWYYYYANLGDFASAGFSYYYYLGLAYYYYYAFYDDLISANYWYNLLLSYAAGV